MDESEVHIIRVTHEVPFRGTLEEAQAAVRRIKDGGGKAALRKPKIAPHAKPELPQLTFPSDLPETVVSTFVRYVFGVRDGERYEALIKHYSRPGQLEETLGRLDTPPYGRTVVMMDLGLGVDEPMSRAEIAKAFGVTKERIRQMQARTYALLRHPHFTPSDI